VILRPSSVGHLVARGVLPKRVRHQKQGLDRADVEAESLRRWHPGHSYWLTTMGAAEVLGVSRPRVKRLVAAGYLPYVKKGDRYLFRRPQVEVISNARHVDLFEFGSSIPECGVGSLGGKGGTRGRGKGSGLVGATITQTANETTIVAGGR
jgi:excisionase family DNA binding protein